MKTFSSAYAGSEVPGSLKFGETGPSGASFIPRHTPSKPCVNPTRPCLPPLSLTPCTQPRLSALGFKLDMGLLQFCWEIPLKWLKSQRWGLLPAKSGQPFPPLRGGRGLTSAAVSPREPFGSNGVVGSRACQEQGPAEESSM